MTRTASGLTATTDERRTFRLLIRLAKAGADGLGERDAIRLGGSGEREFFSGELTRLTEAGVVETVDGRTRLTGTGAAVLARLLPSAVARDESDFPVVVDPEAPMVWRPEPEARTPAEEPPEPDTSAFWAEVRVPEPEPGFWEVTSVDPAGFWA